jgi:7-carboxy-7-deazaguanine synthase
VPRDEPRAPETGRTPHIAVTTIKCSVLTVYEIYLSVQGESTYVGRPCVFVRLAACDLRCRWCDTPYAFTGGKKMSVEEVVARVEQSQCELVEITGGEPLLQPEVYPLMTRLVERGRQVLLETGGHRSTENVPAGVVIILDVKCPASGESDKMHWPNLERLRVHDEVKFVIQDRADFDYACDVVRRFDLTSGGRAVLLSPVHDVLAPAVLVQWILDSHLPVRLQLQTHKYIWSPETRGV